MDVFGTSLLIIGAEGLLVERTIDERVQIARQERPGAETVDLGPAEIADGKLAEAVGGSLFAASSIVVLRDLTALPPDQADLLVETADRPGDDLCLIIAHPGGVKGKALLDRLAKHQVRKVSVEAIKPWDMPQFVVVEGRRLKMRIDMATATALVDAVGADLYALSAAVNQLASDWPGDTLTPEVVNRYFSGRSDVSGFAIADAVMAGQSQQALGLLRWALEAGTAPMLITSALAAALRNQGRYLDLAAQRLSKGEIASALKVWPRKLDAIASQSRTWPAGRVAEAIGAVAQADAQVKGAGTDPGYALEHLLLSLRPTLE
ncbi:MAG: DNA polymerase III subunit delta [Propionibacteriaceae bacterium]|nr:DNA polymerase III subunit delta [Propionibacteriaceae bacterium]